MPVTDFAEAWAVTGSLLSTTLHTI